MRTKQPTKRELERQMDALDRAIMWQVTYHHGRAMPADVWADIEAKRATIITLAQQSVARSRKRPSA